MGTNGWGNLVVWAGRLDKGGEGRGQRTSIFQQMMEGVELRVKCQLGLFCSASRKEVEER